MLPAPPDRSPLCHVSCSALLDGARCKSHTGSVLVKCAEALRIDLGTSVRTVATPVIVWLVELYVVTHVRPLLGMEGSPATLPFFGRAQLNDRIGRRRQRASYAVRELPVARQLHPIACLEVTHIAPSNGSGFSCNRQR